MQAPNYSLASLSMHASTELFTRRPTGGGPYTHSIARVAAYTPAMKDGMQPDTSNDRMGGCSPTGAKLPAICTARFETQGIGQRREVAGDLHGRVRHAGHSLASPPPHFRKVRPAMLSACHCLSPRHAAAGAQPLRPRHVAATCAKTAFQNWFGSLLIHLARLGTRKSGFRSTWTYLKTHDKFKDPRWISLSRKCQ